MPSDFIIGSDDDPCNLPEGPVRVTFRDVVETTVDEDFARFPFALVSDWDLRNLFDGRPGARSGRVTA